MGGGVGFFENMAISGAVLHRLVGKQSSNLNWKTNNGAPFRKFCFGGKSLATVSTRAHYKIKINPKKEREQTVGPASGPPTIKYSSPAVAAPLPYFSGGPFNWRKIFHYWPDSGGACKGGDRSFRG
jgi:hypothetical protein